jgi:hypothetical protein
MVIQYSAAGAGDVEEAEVPLQKARYCRLIRGVKDGPARAAPSGNFVP